MNNKNFARVKITFPPFVDSILDTVTSSGFEIYIVGGAVRDILMDKTVIDWDFTTNARPEEILKLFPDGFYDNQFGTVGLVHPSSPKPYEITTYRRESGYTDKRRPDSVEWGKSLKEDVIRRDFTINALAIDKDGDLIDYVDGLKDVENKIIKAVGNPVERFSEDALRMMRAVRIAAEINFTIEEKTFEAIRLHAPLILHVAFERIREEMLKLLASPNPYEGVVLLRESSLLEQILPELIKTFGVEQKSPERHHIYDVGTHLLYSLKFCPSKDPIVRFATLVHDIGKPQTQKTDESGVITFYNHELVGAKIAAKIADRFKFSKAQKDKFWRLVRFHQFTVDERQTDSAVRRFIRNVEVENLQDMLDLRVGDRLGGGAKETSWRLEEFKNRLVEVQQQPFSVKDLKVNGLDVMKILKIKSGPKVGEVLNKLFAEVEEDQTKNNREYLLKRIKDLY